jgi:type 1 glutamine amidotransferase
MTRRVFLLTTVLALALTPAAFPAARGPIKVLIITGDHGHNWKETSPFLKEILTKAGLKVDVTQTPARDLTPANLARYDVFLLNYKDTKSGGPQTRWSEANKQAFANAVRGGKGLLVYHHASSAFVGGSDFDREFERIIAGGWRKQGNHGKRHVFTVTMRPADHPITRGMPATFVHTNDELYQNSVMLPGSVVLATAFSDSKLDPKNSGKDEPVIWVAHYGKGRVCENVLGHDVAAMQGTGFQTLLIRGVQWCATGEAPYPVPAALQKGRRAP